MLFAATSYLLWTVPEWFYVNHFNTENNGQGSTDAWWPEKRGDIKYLL